ncbi:DoxX-like family protein [Ornithinibacillus halophilus]|uniref:DoxX-like family protein n=1 Tax=Ornithinibacillus halophilus TaxID=930117 RepID=A0A1M5FKL2_9BACI|nr:DoxX-like family protein [Ornithinibacillus halophilus]
MLASAKNNRGEGMKQKPIYVEIPIKTEMDKLWTTTQTPELHEQWDLRFSNITYLPKKEGEPQHFSYRTNIGLGISIEGWGKSVGSYHADDGARTSSLHFGTNQRISPIREGRGYWKYQPQEEGTIKFLTQYNYETNFGFIGKVIDQFLFRPMMGWGTALSFDVLKRWLEQGESPRSQFVRFFATWVLSFFFIFIWLYHGLVPKLIFMHPDEVTMITNVIPLTFDQAKLLAYIAGGLEIAFAGIWLFYRNKRRLFQIQTVIFPFLMVGAIFSEPAYLQQPFNPLTFNLALAVLSLIGLMISRDTPTAKACKRKP